MSAATATAAAATTAAAAAPPPPPMDLPRNVVKKIVRAKLAERAEALQRLEQGSGRGAAGGAAAKKRGAAAAAATATATAPPQVAGDALLALAESARVFISYVTAAANDVAREHKRQTISAEDMLTALDDLDFGELLPELREALDARKRDARDAADKAARQRLAERDAKKKRPQQEREGAGPSEEEEEEEEEEREQADDGDKDGDAAGAGKAAAKGKAAAGKGAAAAAGAGSPPAAKKAKK
jgi:DNA polymerase epsilon subunit 3